VTKGLAIVGTGKMGKLVEELSPAFGLEVRARFDAANNAHAAGLTREALKNVDVAIEFSTPESAPENLLRLAALGIPAVCGTTGWYERLPAIRDAVLEGKTSLVWGANFSVGMNVFFQVVARAAAFFAKHPDYDAWGWEIHHGGKKDAPSGTLKNLAEVISAAGYLRPVNLASNRAGSHPGTHEIGFDASGDTVLLRHTARSRDGFARGALSASVWALARKGVFEFHEIFGELS
jgi:4-hydroxy-tetrahydrodipicolinate reductase